jgi:hypothetical protein
MWSRWRCRGDVIGEQALEAGHVTGLCCFEEGLQQAITLLRIDRRVPLFVEVYARSTRELPCVGVADLERLGDLAERIVERLAEYEDSAFDR